MQPVNTYTPLEAKVRALEDQERKHATLIGITPVGAIDLQRMIQAGWESAGFEEGRAEELTGGFANGFNYAEEMVTPIGKVKILSHEYMKEHRLDDDAVVILEGVPYDR